MRPDSNKLKADASWYSSRIIAIDGKDIGFVVWHRSYSCQSAERAMELQNIFIDTSGRGQSLGFRLVLEVVRDALAQNCAEIKIGVRKENTMAFEFYKKLGCAVTDRNDSWRCKLKRQQMEDMLFKMERKT